MKRSTEASPEQSLTIVMAAYNEEESLLPCAERTLTFLRDHVDHGELIIVNDGSTDSTASLIDELAAREPLLRGCHLRRNSGMGAALLAGFALAEKDWVTILPADGQIDPFDLPRLFEAARHADCVTTIYENRDTTPLRWILSMGMRTLTALILGARARSDGAYLIRRSVLSSLDPRSTSFMLNQEVPLRAKRARWRVATVTTRVHERLGGASKAVTLGRIASTFRDQLALRARFEWERVRRR